MLEKNLQLKSFKNAIEKFKVALQYDPVAVDIALDATIQRFEFTFEMAWKSIRLVAVEGICENGKICLLQEVNNIKKARAYVILIPEDAEDKDIEQRIIQQIEPIKTGSVKYFVQMVCSTIIFLTPFEHQFTSNW
ncbi:MAG: nucleotidyltransferase substrate binding protein [Desulfotomaculum sp.]|nr:nucleotidyltransferase substrate binding protein [Desulfotomaculum sp.]MCL0081476.1 nucleotidyltransferase substrate binding protein [Peptococcaceae bacterium]